MSCAAARGQIESVAYTTLTRSKAHHPAEEAPIATLNLSGRVPSCRAIALPRGAESATHLESPWGSNDTPFDAPELPLYSRDNVCHHARVAETTGLATQPPFSALECGLRPRSTPVVWGDRSSGPLDETQLRQFETTGFLLLPHFQNTLDSGLFHACVAAAQELHDSPGTEGVVMETTTDSIRTIFNAHGRVECFTHFALQAYLLSAARQILGSPVYIHQTHINYKAAFFGEYFFWHQDYAFWANEDGMPGLRALGVALFLTAISHINGPLLVIPGSHQWIAPKTMRSTGSLNNTSAKTDFSATLGDHGLLTPAELLHMSRDSAPQPIVGAEASILFFDPNIAHSSSHNLAPTKRPLLLLFYNSVANTLIHPSRPSYISSQDYRPI